MEAPASIGTETDADALTTDTAIDRPARAAFVGGVIVSAGGYIGSARQRDSPLVNTR